MNFTLVSTGLFPNNHAAAIRQSTLAKGLIELGHCVNFLVLIPQNWERGKTLNYCGVQFMELNSYRGTNKILRHYYILRAIYKANTIVKNQVKQKKIDALVIFSFWSIYLSPIYIFVKSARRKNVKVFYEITELPYVFSNNKSWLDKYEKELLPIFNGIFCISNKINSYVQKFNSNTKKLLTVVDLSFFDTNSPSPFSFPYIGYCGTNQGNKDGVLILIEAFASIAKKYPNLKLVMVGDNSNMEEIRETLYTISKLALEEKVIFTGFVERAMMPVILCNAQILVVSKPDIEQNSGNFPIKIGEYLATGVPIVATTVGEIPLFIKDGESGFLAEPGSVISFAAKMQEALDNPGRAKSIGIEGKRIAQEMFDYKIQTAVMANYISAKLLS